MQDKLYLIGVIQLPEGASLERTEALVRRVSDIALKTDGVYNAVQFPGMNGLQSTNTSNSGLVYFILKPINERKHTATEIAEQLNERFAQEQDGLAFAIMPPLSWGWARVPGSLFTCRIATVRAMPHCRRRPPSWRRPSRKNRDSNIRSVPIRPMCRSLTP